MYKFTLTGPYEGQTMVLNDRYGFTDGVMECDDATAALVSPILCNYYACKAEKLVDPEVPELSDDEKASLKKSATKAN